jgi:trk system potassium uptake protein
VNKQFAIIGLGTFGARILERLSETVDEIVIVDKDSAAVEKYKELATKAYITDAISFEALERVIPEGIDVAIVDVGDNIEAAILITNSLKKLNAKKILVRAESDERGEILRIVGAHKIVYPAREAADKIAPLLVSSSLFSFMPISQSLVLAEIKIQEKYHGMSLIQANLRQAYGINVVAIRKENNEDYVYFNPEYRLQPDDVLLCAATEKDMSAFSELKFSAGKSSIPDMMKGMFGKSKRKTK